MKRTREESVLLVNTDDKFDDDSHQNRRLKPEPTPNTISSQPAQDLTLTLTEKPQPLPPGKDEILSSLRLRRIVRENHGSCINQCVFFPSTNTLASEQDAGTASNVLATIGGPQANFYDNEHCGDHLDIMSHFVVNGVGYCKDAEELPTETPELLTCCWLHVDQDAVLAAAGTDTDIHILSVTRSEEIARLKGHTDRILDLQPHPTDVNLLLSVSDDGNVKLWHVRAKKCLCVYFVKATAAAFHPNGMSFLTSSSKGVVVDWEIPEDLLHLSQNEAVAAPVEHIDEGQQVLWSDQLHGNNYIDCIRYVDEKVLSKSVNGKVVFWDPISAEVGI
ncbi:hypothetical protein SpCBS45565_g06848 [Spizellomyces sp. 'palustris']|nr:hypothetical protein SpCBS45565_g06848 [Spizellomyces sp. 'palustris']